MCANIAQVKNTNSSESAGISASPSLIDVGASQSWYGSVHVPHSRQHVPLNLARIPISAANEFATNGAATAEAALGLEKLPRTGGSGLRCWWNACRHVDLRRTSPLAAYNSPFLLIRDCSNRRASSLRATRACPTAESLSPVARHATLAGQGRRGPGARRRAICSPAASCCGMARAA